MAASTAFKSLPRDTEGPSDRDEGRYVARFTASIEAGLSDADADDVMSSAELEAWLEARRSGRPRR